jgi:polyamine oxidase
MGDADIKKEVTEVVRSMYGSHVKEPTHMYVPRWHSDPLYRGTYRYVSPKGYTHRQVFKQSPMLTLFDIVTGPLVSWKSTIST